MESEGGESDNECGLPLITKSNVGLFVKDEALLEHLHDFSEFVDGRTVLMTDTLKSGKIWVGVDVKDEAMLLAMPEASKIWLDSKKSMGKRCRRELSKVFVKLLFAHVYLPNDVCFKNKGLDPFPGRWSSQTRKLEEEATSNRKRPETIDESIDTTAAGSVDPRLR
ncbi:hypothetical protein R1sor_011372 [Riccia sorocarpa]|uniref:Uncharacterized protein n=1 Tax=Riccia sorocarpa TaxID=122646 RepID=A0ABD3I1U9_9MARC